MKYLFFDEESIGPLGPMARPFSFGYVLTDEKFNVLEKGNFVFNPEVSKEELDGYALGRVVKVRYKDINERQETFRNYYKRIKRLMEQNDVLCFGFAVENDVKYLVCACLFYGLDSINFSYIDVSYILRQLSGQRSKKLEDEYMSYCGMLPLGSHNSENDAAMTKDILKAALKKYKVDLKSFLDDNQQKIGEAKDFTYGYNEHRIDIRIPKEERLTNLNGSDFRRARSRVRELSEEQKDWILQGSINNLLFIRFLDFVKPQEGFEQVLKGKKISISLNYEMYHYQNMLKLVQLISNAGGTYVKKASLSDIFVKQKGVVLHSSGQPMECSKYKYVKEAINEGKNIQVLEFDDFLSLFNLTEEQLNNLPLVDTKYLEDEKYGKQ